MSKVFAEINGKSYGVKEFEYSSDIDNLVPYARITGSFPQDINANTDISIFIQHDNLQIYTLLKGFPSEDIQTDSDVFTIYVLSKTADLVDCSCITKSNYWTKTKLSALVSEICKPFDISVSSSLSEDPTVEKFSVNFGEACFQVIERLCAIYGITPYTDNIGNLVLINKDPSMFPFSKIGLRQEIYESFNMRRGYGDLYSGYIAIGQGARSGKKWKIGDINNQFTASNISVGRYRPIIIELNGRSDSNKVKSRANWELATRQGRSVEISVDVFGFFKREFGRNPTGDLWKCRELVSFSHEKKGISKTLVVAGVTFTKNESSGEMTSLSLRNPEEYRVES